MILVKSIAIFVMEIDEPNLPGETPHKLVSMLNDIIVQYHSKGICTKSTNEKMHSTGRDRCAP